MTAHLAITIRFLQPYFHGRWDGGEPEWPPSPLRLYQALVAAIASRLDESRFVGGEAAMLWLEQQKAPTIYACVGIPASTPYRLYVPDNAGDLVAKKWARGNDGSIADYRTEKDVRPTHLHGDHTVNYVWSLSQNTSGHTDALIAAARSITHLGWGIDQVASEAAILPLEEVEKLSGEQWNPAVGDNGTGLRVPIEGTLQALIKKHQAFLNRMGSDGFRPVPPLTTFQVLSYRRATDPARQPWVVFNILKPDGSGFRPFDTLRRTREVAGMLRHLLANTAKEQDWPDEDINQFIHGKSPNGQRLTNSAISPERFQYLPLPTINTKLNRVESIRRILITAPLGSESKIAWAKQALSGGVLRQESGESISEKSVAMLMASPALDNVVRQYVDSAKIWKTVTPVILPGYDDRNPTKAERLLRTAFIQAGYAKEVIDQSALEWRQVGFRAGVEIASRYLPPENLNHQSRYHVRIQFPHAIAGPLAIGSGRFRGFGLFAASD